jgi:hypothetical protein
MGIYLAINGNFSSSQGWQDGMARGGSTGFQYEARGVNKHPIMFRTDFPQQRIIWPQSPLC